MPEASLMSDSPSRMLLEREEMLVSLESDATATASVGPSAAPSAKAANQADGRHEPVDGEPHDERRGKHQSDGQRQHGLAVAPQRCLVDVLGLVVEQRSDEQHEEQLVIEFDLDFARKREARCRGQAGSV